MAIATTADVAALWGRTLDVDDLETTLVQRRLEQVERIIRKRITDLDDQLEDGTILEADLVQVEADAVLRVVRNHEGIVEETDGNYSVVRVSGGIAELSLTPDEWQLLGVTASKMFQFAPTYTRPR